MWIKAVLLLTVVTAAASTSNPNNNSNKFDKQQFGIDLNVIFAPFVDSQCKAALNPGTGPHECLHGTELCKDFLLIDVAPSDPLALLPLASADAAQLCGCIAQVDYCTSTVGASECSSSGAYCANFRQTAADLAPLLGLMGVAAPSCDFVLGENCARSNPVNALCGANQVMCYKSFSELASLSDTELTASNLCKNSCGDCPNSGPLPTSSKPNFRMCGPPVGCSDDEHCSGATYCRFNQCVPFIELNGRCSPSTQDRCAAPLTCYIRNNEIPTPGSSGVCQFPGYCEIDRDCDSAHYCHALMGSCTPFRLTDESCSPSTDQRCAPSLHCILPTNAQPGESGTCKSETSGGCRQHTDCTSNNYCWNGECTPWGQFGEPCQVSTAPGSHRLCASPLVCWVNGPNGAPGTCRPEGWCEATSDCSGKYCKGFQCTDYAKEGESCNGSLPPEFQTLCAAGLSCVQPPRDGPPSTGGDGVCQSSSNEDRVWVVELFGQLSEPGSCEEFSEVRERLLRTFGVALSMMSITLPTGTFTAVEILLCAHHVDVGPEAKIKAQQAIPPSIATYQFTTRWVIPFISGDNTARHLESTLNSPLAASQLEQNFGIVVNRVDVTSGDIDTVRLCSNPSKEFRSCGSACPPKCSDGNRPIPCPAVCKPGCFCKDPTHVLDDQDNCIPRTLCPVHNNPCEFHVCLPGERCHAEKYNPPILCLVPPCDQYYAVCVPEEENPCMNHHCDEGEVCIKRKYNPPIQCLVPPCDEYYAQCVPDREENPCMNHHCDEGEVCIKRKYNPPIQCLVPPCDEYYAQCVPGGGACSDGEAEDAMFDCLPQRCLSVFEDGSRPDIRGRERETCNCFREATQCFRRHACFDRYMCEDMSDTVEDWFRDAGFYCKPTCVRDDQCTGGSGSRGTVNININNVVNGRREENH